MKFEKRVGIYGKSEDELLSLILGDWTIIIFGFGCFDFHCSSASWNNRGFVCFLHTNSRIGVHWKRPKWKRLFKLNFFDFIRSNDAILGDFRLAWDSYSEVVSFREEHNNDIHVISFSYESSKVFVVLIEKCLSITSPFISIINDHWQNHLSRSLFSLGLRSIEGYTAIVLVVLF